MSLLVPAFRKNIPKEYSGTLDRLHEVALEAILIRIIESIPEEKIPELEAALMLSDSRVLEGFLANEVPNLSFIVNETLGEMQEEATDIISILES